MDGNHRLKAAERLGLQRVPVIPLSYLGGRVVVRDRKDGGLFDLSRFRLVVDTGTLLPYKTTAHEFEPALPVVSIGLNSLLGEYPYLGGSTPRAVSSDPCRISKLAISAQRPEEVKLRCGESTVCDGTSP
jgi:hypothetical protein